MKTIGKNEVGCTEPHYRFQVFSGHIDWLDARYCKKIVEREWLKSVIRRDIIGLNVAVATSSIKVGFKSEFKGSHMLRKNFE